MNLNEMAKTVHAANIKWWQDLEAGEPIKRNRGQLLMLVITELAEAVEGIRKDLMDDKLPHRKMEEVEMADAFIRLLDYAGGFNLFLHARRPVWVVDQQPEDKSENMLFIIRTIIGAWQSVGKENEEMLIDHAIFKIICYCEFNRLDLMGAYEEKMQFNANREDHKHEARKAAGGKKF